jgi:hypothetical protein
VSFAPTAIYLYWVAKSRAVVWILAAQPKLEQARNTIIARLSLLPVAGL